MPEPSRLEFLEKFLANNFTLSDAEENISGSLNSGSMADLPLLQTMLAIHQKSQEPSFWEAIDFFCFISICKFGSFKTPFAGITSLPELYIGLIDSVGINEKKWFLWDMEAAQAAGNHGNEWHFT